jgi:hypothetical protein
MAKRSEVKKRTPKGLTDKQKKMLKAVIGGAIPPVGAVMLMQNLVKKAKSKSPKDKIFIGNPKQQQQKKGPTMVVGVSRPQSGPKKKKKLSGISGKQKKENEKRANIREGQRGKVGPKRNVIKTKSGILRDKSGKAVKRLSREEILKRRKANK